RAACAGALLPSRPASTPVKDPKDLPSDLRIGVFRMSETHARAACIANSFAEVSRDLGAALRSGFAIESKLESVRCRRRVARLQDGIILLVHGRHPDPRAL